MKKSEVMKSGHWPDFFLKDLISPIPPVTISCKERLTWKCSNCGLVYDRLINDALKGYQCPHCVRQKLPKYPEWFINDIKDSPDKDKILAGDLKRKDHAQFRCYKHGLYTQFIFTHLKGIGCPLCRKENKISKPNKSRLKNPFKEEFISRIHLSSDKIRAQVGTLKTTEKIEFICKEHGVYLQRVSDAMYQEGCPLCSKMKGYNKRSILQLIKHKEALNDVFDDKVRKEILDGNVKVSSKIEFICSKHGVYKQRLDDHLYHGNGCPTCGAEGHNWVSSLEKKLRSDLENCGVKTIGSLRTLIKSSQTGLPMEIDIYCPDAKLAIEVNGVYYHSIEHMNSVIQYNAPGGKENYHRMKTDLCEQKGIQLIHLFEDDLRDRYEVCLNLIKSKLGLLHHKRVYARQCEVKEVTSEVAYKFYNKYHIQGWGQGICYGLYYQGHLMSCMSMRKACSNTKEKGSWELNRYASINNYFVVGGFEKLENFFVRKLSIKRLISFADKTISNGALYYKQGYKLESVSDPDYQYVYKGKRWHKFNFRIKRFKDDSDLLYKEGLTEFQLAQLNGITRIYDCGKMKFVKEFV